jgi:hypothetical protein
MQSPSRPALQKTHSETPAPRSPSTRPTGGVRRLRAGAVIAVLLAVALGAWVILGGDDDKRSGASAPASSAASEAQLRGIPAETGHPLYWAGRRSEFTYELTRTADGNVFVRYLPPGIPVGAERPNYLTIGTYPRPRALQAVRSRARRRGTVSFPVPGGGIAAYTRDRPRSVYLAFPREDVQIEVYDPSAERARRLARSGRVRPIG